MCGIVAYFGGAGNNLTRIFTGMSAIIYRAPDSTGIGFFGDEAETIRTRKSIGSVRQLVEAILEHPAYPNPAEPLTLLGTMASERVSPQDLQRQLLLYENQALDSFNAFVENRRAYPSFDELVELKTETPLRISAGWPGRPGALPDFFVRSRKDLINLRQRLLTDYDMSPVVMHALIRRALAATIERRSNEIQGDIMPSDILSAFEQLFENLFVAELPKRPCRVSPGRPPRNPRIDKYLWRYLKESPLQIPPDYDRDAVRCLFRLLDGALMCRVPHQPQLGEALADTLHTLWPESRSKIGSDWRTLYTVEKGVNVYGWAAAAALTYLQRNDYQAHLLQAVPANDRIHVQSRVDGETDPVLLRFLVFPVLGHGRWAVQSPATLQNAHPFYDAKKQRIVVLNGHFDAGVENRLREFLNRVARVPLRSANSTEYLALLWGYYFDLLTEEQRRYDAIRAQVESELEESGIGSRSIDYQVYQQVKDKSVEDLDEQAFLAATRQLIRDGGQVAVAGLSLHSPRRIYVASHNRPVFIVQRLQNDDFMVVSDINAAMGLFPQALIHQKIIEIEKRPKEESESFAELKVAGAVSNKFQDRKRKHQKEPAQGLEDFRVNVYPLDGEELYAKITTTFEGPQLIRKINISDFNGDPRADVEAFKTVLNPMQIGKDFEQTFHESHLQEIPDRLNDILRTYLAADSQITGFKLREGLLQRRFGPRLANLKRIVLVGMGSAYNIGWIGKYFIQNFLPKMDVEVLMASTPADLARALIPESDLVVLLSWSSTTAEVVEFARKMMRQNMVLIGITEKRFADMALIAQKSGGVIQILSGEEVTVAGIKSTVCMLFCLELFAAWLISRKGLKRTSQKMLEKLQSLPRLLEQVLDDQKITDLSKQVASESAQSRICMIIDALHTTGTGREAAFKLEENSGTVLGRSMDYCEMIPLACRQDSERCFLLVNATHRPRIKEALQLMAQLKAAGIEFAAVTCPSREQTEIIRYSNGRCILVPKADKAIQPLVDLVFYYQFVFYYATAHGRDFELPPRNRAKSVTASRSDAGVQQSSSQALFHLKHTDRLIRGAPIPKEQIQTPSVWEHEAAQNWEQGYYRQMRRLVEFLASQNPCAKLLQPYPYKESAWERLSRAVCKHVTDEKEIILTPLDRTAAAAANMVAEVWPRYLGCTMRVTLPGERRVHMNSAGFIFFISAGKHTPHTLEALIKDLPAQSLWAGPGLPPAAAKAFGAALGCFSMDGDFEVCGQELLYAVLSFILLAAWKGYAAEKALSLSNHFQKGAQIIITILNDFSLKQRIQEAVFKNRSYDKAFVVGPGAGIGRTWVDRFDQRGGFVTAWHPYAESAHGPLATVDPQVKAKYVRIEERAKMVARYGEARTAEWERQFLHGRDIDEFLGALPFDRIHQAEAPFYAEGDWYYPELRDDYDTAQDNLILLDATDPRYFQHALDELSTYGCRYARLLVISQEGFQSSAKKKALYSDPIGHLIMLPSMRMQSGETYPISELLLPFAMNLVGAAVASAAVEIKRKF